MHRLQNTSENNNRKNKPALKQIIGMEQQGFIQESDITGNLVLVTEIMKYWKEEEIEAYMIMMDFKKA